MNTLVEALCNFIPEAYHSAILNTVKLYQEKDRLTEDRAIVWTVTAREVDQLIYDDFEDPDGDKLEVIAKYMLPDDWLEHLEDTLRGLGYVTRHSIPWVVEGFEDPFDFFHWVKNDGYAKYLTEEEKEEYDDLDSDQWRSEMDWHKKILTRAGWVESVSDPWNFYKGEKFDDL